MQVLPLKSRFHVSGLDDIWHISSSLIKEMGSLFDITDHSLSTDLVVHTFSGGP
jgi:hypothetical protein